MDAVQSCATLTRHTFLTLPAEIRELIYKEHFEDDSKIEAGTPFKEPPILTVSKQIRQEAHPVFWDGLTLDFTVPFTGGSVDLSIAGRAQLYISRYQLSELRRMTVHWHDMLIVTLCISNVRSIPKIAMPQTLHSGSEIGEGFYILVTSNSTGPVIDFTCCAGVARQLWVEMWHNMIKRTEMTIRYRAYTRARAQPEEVAPGSFRSLVDYTAGSRYKQSEKAMSIEAAGASQG